jgi:hypothetical protein
MRDFFIIEMALERQFDCLPCHDPSQPLVAIPTHPVVGVGQ